MQTNNMCMNTTSNNTWDLSGVKASRRPSVSGPLASDIICVKNKKFLNHPGNVIFRDVIDDFCDEYARADGKQEKMLITKKIVHILKSQYNARFLRPGKDGVWKEINNTLARDKVGHALRFALKKSTSSPKNEGSWTCTSSNTSCATSIGTLDDEEDLTPEEMESFIDIARRQQAILREMQVNQNDIERETSLQSTAQARAEAELYSFELLQDEDFDLLLNDTTVLFRSESNEAWDALMKSTTL